MPLSLKICCITSVAEARLAIEYGADAIGLVSSMPSGPGVIDEAQVETIVAAVAGVASTWLLTSATNLARIVAQQRRTQVDTLQLVDTVDPQVLADLRVELPKVRLVQVIHVCDQGAVEQGRAVAPRVDAILLDSGNPSAKVRTLGGTGNVHDWSISRRLRGAVSVPVYLAGGLRASNVEAALDAVDPDGLDVCSGLRTDGALDRDKLAAFVARIATRREIKGRT